MKIRTIKRLICPAAVVLLVFALCWLFPRTGDDWFREAVGTSIHSLRDLLSILWSKWRTTNPRVLGNVLAYLSGGRPVLRWLLRGFFFSAAMLLAVKTARLHTAPGFLLMSCAVVALPREMFGQIYPWGAGFFNYVPPVVMILAAFCLLRPVLEQARGAESALRMAALFCLGFAGQLFVENDTLYAVFAGAVLLVWYFYEYRRVSRCAAAYLLGAIFGALGMFLSPAYRSFTGADQAYSFGDNLSLPEMMRENFKEICYHMIQNAPVIVAVLTVLLLWLLLRRRKSALDFCLGGLLAALGLALLVNHWRAMAMFSSPWLAVAWYLLIGIALVRWMPGGRETQRAVFYWLGALAAAAPLLVVQPIGSRCLYLSYVLLLIVCGLVLKALFDGRTISARMLIPAALLTCLVFGFYFSRFLPIHRMEQVRLAAIEAAMAERAPRVEIPAFPYADYLWNPDITMPQWYYYETPGDFEIVIEDMRP